MRFQLHCRKKVSWPLHLSPSEQPCIWRGDIDADDTLEPGVTAVDVDDLPDFEVEIGWLAGLDGPDVHPAETRNTTTRISPMRKQRDVLFLQSILTSLTSRIAG